jgi:predicted phosphohydrolase
MAVWALADLHLSFGTPNKEMNVFGPEWVRHGEKIQQAWEESVKTDDLVLLPGDISWAMRLDDALVDLAWIDKLPGTKVMIRGNHDYWWPSLSRLSKILPPSLHAIHNTSFHWKGIGIAGSRLWDTSEYSFGQYIQQKNVTGVNIKENHETPEESDKIFQRELMRFELSLKSLKNDTSKRIAMTHYPPISADLQESQASRLMDRYRIDICVFGHLHNMKKEIPAFGIKDGIQYICTAADYVDFKPVLILE